MTPPVPDAQQDLGGAIDIAAVVPSGADGASTLVAELASAGVSIAVARHRDAIQADPATGNQRAVEAARAQPDRILPVAVVAPLRSADPVRDVARAATQRAVALWLGSAAWAGSPATPSAATDALLAAIGRSGLPLLVPVERWGDASAIGERTAHLGIPVILVGSHYRHIVDDLAAAERWTHLHLETSALAHFGAIETVVARIGHERLLLGTGAPDRPPSAPVNAILAAALPDHAKRAVLGGNAARLLGLATHPPVRLRPPLLAKGALDVHGHLGPLPWDVPDLAAAAFADAQERRGVAVTVVSSIEAIAAHAPTGNATLAAVVAAEPRLRGYLVADPRDLSATRADLRRWGEAPGIVGVKVHSEWSGVPTAAPATVALFEVLAAHGRPVKIHVAGEGWEVALRGLADRHPDLPIIAAHAGPGAPSVAMARVASLTDAVHLELASSFARLEEVRSVIQVAGPGRVLFGSDAPLLDPSFVLGTYADAGLHPASHPGVFRGTAERLFGGLPA